MRRITMWLVSTVAAVILLFSYKTSTAGPGLGASAHAASNNAPGIVSGPGAAAGTPTPTPAGSASSASGSSNTASSNAGSSNSGSGSSGQDTVVNGTVAQTRWGPVQVQVRISSGKISDISVLQQPDGNGRDAEINSYALPVLKQQVLDAQSANIDGVSGATVTSDGYRESLQAALDAAHFKS